jgi:hypothetical protein
VANQPKVPAERFNEVIEAQQPHQQDHLTKVLEKVN